MYYNIIIVLYYYLKETCNLNFAFILLTFISIINIDLILHLF